MTNKEMKATMTLFAVGLSMILLSACGGGSSSDTTTGAEPQPFFFRGVTESDVGLWKTDGTEKGTLLVKDFFPGTLLSKTRALTRIDNELFFFAMDWDDSSQDSLWKSDGTGAGTRKIKTFLTVS
jgi:ELWxxDGT repeat protein